MKVLMMQTTYYEIKASIWFVSDTNFVAFTKWEERLSQRYPIVCLYTSTFLQAKLFRMRFFCLKSLQRIKVVYKQSR